MSFRYDFDSAVYDNSSFTPAPLNYSLSASGNQVVLDIAGTQNGFTVYGVAFDAQSAEAGPLSSVTLTSPDGDNTTIRTNLSAGATLATISKDNSCVIYTLPAGGAGTLSPVSSGADVSDPELRRKVHLGLI